MITFYTGSEHKVEGDTSMAGKISSYDINLIFKIAQYISIQDTLALKTDVLDIHRNRLLINIDTKYKEVTINGTDTIELLSSTDGIVVFNLDNINPIDQVYIGNNLYPIRDYQGSTTISNGEYIGMVVDDEFYIVDYKFFGSNQMEIDILKTEICKTIDSVVLTGAHLTGDNPTIGFTDNGKFIIDLNVESSNGYVNMVIYIEKDTTYNVRVLYTVSKDVTSITYSVNTNGVAIHGSNNVTVNSISYITEYSDITLTQSDVTNDTPILIDTDNLKVDNTPASFDLNNYINVFSGPDKITDFISRDDAVALGMSPSTSDTNGMYVVMQHELDGKMHYMFIGYEDEKYTYFLYDGTSIQSGNSDIDENSENNVKDAICGNHNNIVTYSNLSNASNVLSDTVEYYNNHKVDYHPIGGGVKLVINNNNVTDDTAVNYNYLEANYEPKGDPLIVDSIKGGTGNLPTLRRTATGSYTNLSISETEGYIHNRNITPLGISGGFSTAKGEVVNYFDDIVVGKLNGKIYMNIGEDSFFLEDMFTSAIEKVFVTQDKTRIFIEANGLYVWNISIPGSKPFILLDCLYVRYIVELEDVILISADDTYYTTAYRYNKNTSDFEEVLSYVFENTDIPSGINHTRISNGGYIAEGGYNDDNLPITPKRYSISWTGIAQGETKIGDLTNVPHYVTIIGSYYYSVEIDSSSNGGWYLRKYDSDFNMVNSVEMDELGILGRVYGVRDGTLFIEFTDNDKSSFRFGNGTLVIDPVSGVMSAIVYGADVEEEITSRDVQVIKHTDARPSYLLYMGLDNYPATAKKMDKDDVGYKYTKMNYDGTVYSIVTDKQGNKIPYTPNGVRISRHQVTNYFNKDKVMNTPEGYRRVTSDGYFIYNRGYSSIPMSGYSLATKNTKYKDEGVTQAFANNDIFIDDLGVLYYMDYNDNTYIPNHDYPRAFILGGDTNQTYILWHDGSSLQFGKSIDITASKDRTYTDLVGDINDNLGNINDCQFSLTDNGNWILVKNLKTGAFKIYGSTYYNKYAVIYPHRVLRFADSLLCNTGYMTMISAGNNDYYTIRRGYKDSVSSSRYGSSLGNIGGRQTIGSVQGFSYATDYKGATKSYGITGSKITN